MAVHSSPKHAATDAGTTRRSEVRRWLRRARHSRRSVTALATVAVLTAAGTSIATFASDTTTAGAATTSCTPDPGYTDCVIYTYSGADQSFTVPANITTIRVKAWGAGGGGSAASTINIGAPGGSGAYVQGDLSVTPGDSYAVVVGQGGGADGAAASSTACKNGAYGFGGACVPQRGGTGSFVDGGGGGGLSGLFTGSPAVTATDQARALLVAGGGGGSEGSNSCGTGGTSMSAPGGAGGNAFSGGMPTMRGVSGVYNTTRNGDDNTGGGGGYTGGTATARLTTNTCIRSANGGSNFVAGAVTSPINAAGTETTAAPSQTSNKPPHTTEAQYTAGVGVGLAATITPGGNGQVVVEYGVEGAAWSCTAYGYLFQTPTTSAHDIIQVDLATGAWQKIGSTVDYVNGLDFNPLDNYVYGSTLLASSSYLTRIAADGTETRLGAQISTGYNFGAFDPAGHLWQLNGDSGRWAENDLIPGSATYGTAIATGTAGLPAAIAAAPGDWSFIGGSLYGIGYTSSHVAELMKFSSTAHTWSIVGAVAAPGTSAVGATFTDGTYLYMSDNASGQIYRVDPTTRTAIKVSAGPVSGGNDGARCASAQIPTITVAKTVAGRVAATDQFTVGLQSSDGTTLTSATTTGTATSASTTNWPVSQGATYTITDAMAAGSTNAITGYNASIACLDGAGATVATTGTGPTWTMTATDPTDYTCTVTNAAPATGTLAVIKQVGGRAEPRDQFTVGLKTSGGTVLGTASTTGTQQLVSVAAKTVSVGSTYTITDAMAAGSVNAISKYAPTISCLDTADGSTVAAAGNAPTWTFTPPKPDAYQCTVTNTPALAPLPTVSCTTDPNVFNTGYNAVTGGVLPNNSSDAHWEVSGPTAQQNAGVSLPAADATWSLANVGNLVPAFWDPSPFSNSQWISQQNLANPTTTGGDWYYRYRFTLADGVDPASVALSMKFLADNAVAEVFVNGIAQSTKTTGLPQTSLTAGGGTAAYSYAGYRFANTTQTLLNHDWQTGPNTMVVQIKSAGPTSYEGFDAQVQPSALCPATLKVAKQVAGRVQAGDQFTVAAKDTAAAVVATTTTSGTQTSASSAAAPVKVGSSYTITDAMAAGSPSPITSYSGVIACVDGKGNPVTTTGTGPTWTIAVANPSDYSCTVTNTPAVATMTIAKQVGGRAEVRDQFTVGVTTSGGASLASVTTTGTQQSVTSAAQPVTVGSTYTITDAMAAGSVNTLAKYAPTVSCVDTADGSSALVSGATPSWTFTPTKADAYACTVTNTPAAAPIPTVDCSTSSNIFNTGYNAATGGILPDNASDAHWEVSGPTAPQLSAVSFPAANATWSLANIGNMAPLYWSPSPYSNSQWISQQTIAHPESDAGDWYYRYQFNLASAVDPASVALAMDFLADNSVSEVYVNGVAQSTKTTGLPQSSLTPGDPTNFSGPYLAFGFEKQNAASTLLNHDWKTGLNSIVVQIKSAGPAQGFDAQVRPSALCPATISVTKQVAGRVQAKDQFTVGIQDNKGAVLATANTIGTDTSVSTAAAPATAGQTYTITDAMVAGSPDAIEAYDATIVCTNTLTGKQVTLGDTAPTWTLHVTDPGAYQCVVTNTPGAKSYTVSKSASTSGPLHPGQQLTYTVLVHNTGNVPYTAAAPATFTDNLAGVLDDATYGNDATNGATVTGSTLSWSGVLAAKGNPGDTVAVTYTVTVNTPDVGDSVLTNTVVGGTNCPAGSTDPACSTTTAVQSYRIVKSSPATAVNPGEKVDYTVTVTNTGSVPYTAGDPASFTDDLTKVLDDATYGGGAAASDGSTVSYTAPTLSWSGALPVKGVVTITYSVTVKSPDTGNKVLDNTVVTPPNGPCPAGSTNPDCRTTVPARSYSVVKQASAATAKPGDVITYTITVHNLGQVAYPANAPATFTDDLTGVLDDASITTPATSDNGSPVTYTAPTLSWAGALPVDATVVITYKVTVKVPDTGDGLLRNVVSTGVEGSCAATSTDPGCVSQVAVAQFTAVKSASSSQTAPGRTITYTVTVSNTGQVPFTAGAPADFTDDLTNVLDDATYRNDAAASDGSTVTYTAPVLTWAGALDVGQTITVRYTVTVNRPDTGDHELVNAVDSDGPIVCATHPCTPVTVPVADYTLVKTASSSSGGSSAKPGDTITYQVTVHNIGAVDYTAAAPATFSDDLTGVLDDAQLGTHDDLVFDGVHTLSWQGALAVGDSVAVTYTVTVDKPDTGDHVLANAVVGGQCLSGSTDPTCGTTTAVADYTVTKSASATSATPGAQITYTVVVTNTGQVPFAGANPATFSDDLTDVLDDASFGSADNGASFDGKHTLSWSGALAVKASVTVTYDVTVNTPDTGNHTLKNVVTGGQCAAGSTDTACGTSTPVADYTLTKVASAATATPGAPITYTVTVHNTGTVAFGGANLATFADDLSGVVDDASFTGADSGAVFDGKNTLTWSGPLALQGSVTVTYTATVNQPDTGDHVLANAVVGGQCVVGSTAPACGTSTPVADYTVTKTASVDTVTPGAPITYTVTVANIGTVPFTAGAPAGFADDLTDVLDDAALDTSSLSTGLTFDGTHTLSWKGALAVKASVTVTYTVTVDKPDTGNHVLANTVTGGQCASPSTDPRCGTTTAVADYTVTKAASTTATKLGGVVVYTVTVANIGTAPFTVDTPATFTDDLSDVVDDATFVSADNGASFDGVHTLTWSGALAVKASTTVTYSVTVNTPDTGNHTLHNVVTGGQCATGSTDTACGTSTPIADYTVTKTASAATATAGGALTYTVTVHNTGNVDYTDDSPATFTDDLSGVLDDGELKPLDKGLTFDGDHTLSWSGALAIGATVAVTYTVTIDQPDTGDHVLTNAVVGGQCAAGSTAPACGTSTPVAEYTVTKTASTTTVHPGGKIVYTVQVHNTGAVAYTVDDPATFTDNLAGVLDDASYDGNADNGATYTAPVLSWSGALALDDTQTVTYSVTVNEQGTGEGDGDLPNAALGGDCTSASVDGCAVDPKLQAYRVVKTADKVKVTAGEKITYKVTLTNTGQVAYTADDQASFTDDLTGVLDDAVYNGDADNGATYAEPTLSWSGALPVGGTEIITYSITVNSPDTGDAKVDNTVVTPPDGGGNCPVDSTNPDCTAKVPGNQLQVRKTASAATAAPGQKITYTVTVKNTGQNDFTAAEPATFSDTLSGVLDDATYNGDADQGATVTDKVLTWSGALGVGDTVTVTYSVTVNKPDTGDKLLRNVVQLPPTENSNCTTGSTDPDCQTVTPVAQYTVTKTASTARIAAGATVTYTVTVTNSGQIAYTTDDPASFRDDLTDVLDDAAYNGDASNGAVFSSPALSWQGALPVGGTQTVTYSVTVHNPDHGNGTLHNVVTTPTDPGGIEQGNCPAGGTDPNCSTSTAVAQYSVVKKASTGTVHAGGTVTYTVTVTNTGQAAYTTADPAAFSDDMSDVLDDAAYNGDADQGATFSNGTLSWHGAVAVGGTRTVTYSVTVHDPDHGDGKLLNVVTTPLDPSGLQQGNCSATTPDPACSTQTGVEATSTGGGGTASTGNDTQLELLAGGLLLAAGALFLLIGIRRGRPRIA